MSSSPLVSVVIIFLNGEPYLEEAIQSVYAQTYPHWELLLVDDGSTDGSAARAERHAIARPGQVRCLAHPGRQNRGMSASRNLGIGAARGAYIALLDADDLYRPEKLERQVALLEAHPDAAIVFGGTTHWYSWTGRPEDQGRDFRRRVGDIAGSLVRPPELVRRFLRYETWTPGTCGVLMRREPVDAVGGFEERFRGMFEDQVFFYKLCLRFSAYVESGSWDLYRQHPASTTRSGPRARWWRAEASRGHFLSWLEEHLREQGVRDRRIWQALRREQWPYRYPLLYGLRMAARRAVQLVNS